MSNLEIFKIGIGPSSSHTVGPMVGAKRFVDELKEEKLFDKVTSIKVVLHGSLSLTGKGHLSDMASILGLSGLVAKTLTSSQKAEALRLLDLKKLNLGGEKLIDFSDDDIIFDNSFLKLHENGFIIKAYHGNDLLKEKDFYSVGGGFVKTKEEMTSESSSDSGAHLPFYFDKASALLWLCNKHNKNIAEISLNYELNFHSLDYINNYCKDIYLAMKESFIAGSTSTEYTLPGVIKLRRRAPFLAKKLSSQSMQRVDDLDFIDYFSLYAMSIAEENASGNKVVTAPTNGACAVVPAVLLYLKNHKKDIKGLQIRDFLLVAMAIGSLFKKNASISGAEAGCQAEIGSASSMAAAAFAYSLGACASDCCSAAEIAMEHHLGLTCDPVAGLVQIPCIERNTFGAIKAVSAAKMAMDRDSEPSVGLDEVIRTMYETGKDMNLKYKETSLGGLAKNFSKHC